ncbi:MAG: lipocalin-like domain-containing protein [Myxococcota bacterium]
MAESAFETTMLQSLEQLTTAVHAMADRLERVEHQLDAAHRHGDHVPTADRLVGSWHLERFVIRYDDGRPELYPFGTHALGVLTYTAEGWMSAILSRSDRPKLGVASLETATRASETHKAQAFDGYLSYAGRWTLSGHHITHTIALALTPDLVGQAQTRQVTLAERDTLLMLTYQRTPASGVTRHYHLDWRRNS